MLASPPEDGIQWQGMRLDAALDQLRSDGIALVYSSNLVLDSMSVQQEPDSSEPLLILEQILQPHRLAVQALDGILLVVRSEAEPMEPLDQAMLMLIIENQGILSSGVEADIQGTPALPAREVLAPGVYQFRQVPAGKYVVAIGVPAYQRVSKQIELEAGEIEVLKIEMELGPAELEQLSVSASRYVLFSNSQFFIDQRAIQALPDLGEDPIRSVQRLPGAAAGGLSSRSHFRGGLNDETTIILNGMELLDPFHIRNYHSIFSTIDARAISGVEAYTGGFPANFGDSMSGVLLLDTQRPDAPRRTELGLSVYNTSALFSGYSKNGKVDWLLSARRSNLDLLLSEDLGRPRYFDVFAELGINFSDDSRLSINALYADDEISVVLESDPTELEQSKSRTNNGSLWLSLENQWTADWSSITVLSVSHLENIHQAEVNDPDQMYATVTDDRDADLFGLRQEWTFSGIPDHYLRWGGGVTYEQASFHYRGAARYVAFYANYPGIQNPTASAIDADPDGYSMSLFLTDRWSLTEQTALELGVRWDKQTYTQPVFGDQYSPRLSLLHELNPSMELRLTWGRYYQSQGIQELQVEDGLDHYWSPQRADHWIAGFQYQTAGNYRFRAEAFIKDYDILKPRFENLFDSLALIPQLEPDRVRLDPEFGTARGLELSLEYRGEGELNWWASFTWSRATDRINGSTEKRSWDQTLAFQGGLAWQRGPWELGLALNVHSGWPITSMALGYDEQDDEYFPIPGARNAQQLNTFGSLDFRISRYFPVKIGKLSGFFEVTNATNRKNSCCVDYDTEENDDGTVYLDATYDYWLPILPAIGILWEF